MQVDVALHGNGFSASGQGLPGNKRNRSPGVEDQHHRLRVHAARFSQGGIFVEGRGKISPSLVLSQKSKIQQNLFLSSHATQKLSSTGFTYKNPRCFPYSPTWKQLQAITAESPLWCEWVQTPPASPLPQFINLFWGQGKTVDKYFIDVGMCIPFI